MGADGSQLLTPEGDDGEWLLRFSRRMAFMGLNELSLHHYFTSYLFRHIEVEQTNWFDEKFVE